MKIKYILLIFFVFVLLVNFSYSLSDEDKQRLIEDAKNEKDRIMKDCIEDPYNCPCEDIACEEILESDDSDKTINDKYFCYKKHILNDII